MLIMLETSGSFRSMNSDFCKFMCGRVSLDVAAETEIAKMGGDAFLS